MMKFKIIILITIFFCINETKAQNAKTLKPATQLLDNAYKVASSENKKVFVFFHASWCGWCKKMDKQIKDAEVANSFNKNYVFVHLDVNEPDNKKDLENPGADTYLKQFGGDKAGMPFWLVLDTDKKVITDSFINNENLGCPSSADEVSEFLVKLQATSKLNANELATISEVFLRK